MMTTIEGLRRAIPEAYHPPFQYGNIGHVLMLVDLLVGVFRMTMEAAEVMRRDKNLTKGVMRRYNSIRRQCVIGKFALGNMEFA